MGMDHQDLSAVLNLKFMVLLLIYALCQPCCCCPVQVFHLRANDFSCVSEICILMEEMLPFPPKAVIKKPKPLGSFIQTPSS